MLGGLDGALLAGYFRGANVDIGNEYLLSSIAVVVIGGTSVAGGKANVPGIWGASLFLVLLLTMLNTFGVSAGVRLVATGAHHRGGDRGGGQPKPVQPRLKLKECTAAIFANENGLHRFDLAMQLRP